ncbi:amidohydrolase family protein [Devosia ginsengisoli]|uniref:Amidohydrolase n=1 Tax=Devosia ginsengisoli TaxID=400770 RepID=A0A5B8LX18_9HYPH|nr:amidohydrolase family protein [Devosia ginsengisoli]QDZ11970.1 amidohydrolase [Devosia ginsengisoli]
MTTKAIDIVVNVFTPEEFEAGQIATDDGFRAKTRQDPDYIRGMPMEAYIEKMDRAGIERSLLVAVRSGDMRIKGSVEIPYKRVFDLCQQYPDRFSGLAGIDPTRGMQGLRDLEVAVKEYGFVGAHFYPHWFSMRVDAAQIYPYYAKCCELDIPIMMQVGNCLIYQRDRRLPTIARPIHLDQVAIDFPELKLIGIHIGYPWTDEMIAMAWKHPNVYLAGDAYAPKHWPQQLVHFANTYGQDKFLFGTDWPVIDPERAMREVGDLNFREEPLRKILRDNALNVFKLP